MNFIEDKELNLKEKNNDLLNGKSYAETLKQIIQKAPEKGTFCIGVFGEWGSGKSSIIKTVKDDLTKDPKHNGKIKFVIYDAWKYVNDSFRRMFLLNLQEKLGLGRTDLMEKFYCNKTIDQKIELKFSEKHFNVVLVIALLGVVLFSILMALKMFTMAANVGFTISLVSLLTVLIFKCFNELKTSSNIPYLFAPEQFEDCFMDIISKTLKKNSIIKVIKEWVTGKNQNDKLIIVIDNIDRCNCETAYELLTNIKNFMGDYDGLIFIIPIDDRALKKHLINDKNSDKDAEEFLRKFFNVELRIKPLENVELYDFANKLNIKHKLNLKPDTINIVANEYATNPRRIIQLFNNLSAELNVLSQNCDEDFLFKNQSIICKALIIREEWSEYYNKIKKDNKLLKAKCYQPNLNNDTQNDKDVDRDKELNMFLNKTYCLTSDTDLSVIEKILSNSTVFQELPKEILDSITTFNIEQLTKYLQESDEYLNLSIKYLQDRLEKSITKQTFGTETIQVFVSLLAINKYKKLSSTNNKKIETTISGEVKNFLSFMPEEYFSLLSKYINDLGSNNYLSNEVSQYIEENLQEDTLSGSFVFKLYKSILLECNDIKKLQDKFKSWYNLSSETLSELDLKEKTQYIVTDDAIEYILSKTENTNEDSWCFEDLEYLARYGKLTKKQKNLIFTFFKEQTPSYNGSNEKHLLNALQFISRVLKYVKIEKNEAFIDFYKNIFKKVQISYQQHSLLQKVKTENDWKIIVDFLILTYQSGYNTPAIAEQLKELFDKGSEAQMYIMTSIRNMCDNIQIFPLQYVVFNASEITEESLYVLSKIIREKDNDGSYEIDEKTVRNKLDYLVKNLSQKEYKEQVNKFFENTITDSRVKDMLVDIISSTSQETIMSLSTKLQGIAFDRISDDINPYKNEKALLEAMATSKVKKHINALIQLIKENLAAKTDFEYWKSLYEKIDEKNISNSQKKVIQSLIEAEIEEKE